MDVPSDLQGYRFDGYVIVHDAFASWGGNIRKRWCGPWDNLEQAKNILESLKAKYPHIPFYMITWWHGGRQIDGAHILVDRGPHGESLEQPKAA